MHWLHALAGAVVLWIATVLGVVVASPFVSDNPFFVLTMGALLGLCSSSCSAFWWGALGSPGSGRRTGESCLRIRSTDSV